MPPSPVKWDLTALKTGSAVEQAVALKIERMKQIQGATEGGSLLGDDGKSIATLAVSWMMALKAGCVQPTTRGYVFCNHWSRGFYVIGLLSCLGVALATALEPDYYHPDSLDWFAWTSWATVAVSETLFIMYRIIGRCQQLINPQPDTGVRECLASFVRLTPFGAGWQAVFVVTVDVLTSATFLFGYLVIHMQMMIDANDSNLHIVREDQRALWTLLWTCIYAVVTFGLVWAAVVDPSRIGEMLGQLEIVDRWSLELQAWRVVFLGLIMPTVGVAFVVYVNVCCEGPFYYYR